ncbi:signal recognition particle-docking protein FtsY [Nanoarchaeota archaeon]
MFKFLKEKLKGAIDKISKEAEEEAEIIEESEEQEQPKEVKKQIEKKAEPKKKETKKVSAPKKEKTAETTKPEEKEKETEVKEEETPDVEEKEEVSQETKKGFFSRIKDKIIGEEEVEEVIPDEEPEEKKEEKEIKKEEISEKEKEEETERKEPAEEIKKEKETKKEEIPEEVKEKEPEQPKKIEKEEPINAEKEEILEEPKKEKEKTGFFSKISEVITKKSLSEEKFNELFWDLELVLLENNVAVEVIDKMREDLKAKLVETKVIRGQIFEIIQQTLIKSINEILSTEKINIIEKIKAKQEKPFVIIFSGINGSGKTTTIAKMAKFFQNNNLNPIIAASDTFRAAAINQLEEHANNLNVKLIKHDYGSDPAAVAFDAIKYAKTKNIDIVMVDTAGRLHSNVNLMEEMKKIVRVANPDLNIFIGESITGNDCVEQATKFNEAIGIDAIILSKVDVDEKGGAALSVSYVTGKPIIYIGTGQTYDDLVEFDKDLILQNLGLS